MIRHFYRLSVRLKPMLLFFAFHVSLFVTAQAVDNPFLSMTHKPYCEYVDSLEKHYGIMAIENSDSAWAAAASAQMQEAAQISGDKRWELEARFLEFQARYTRQLNRIKTNGDAAEKAVDEAKKIIAQAKQSGYTAMVLRGEYFIFTHYWHNLENHKKAFLQWNVLEKLLSDVRAEDFPLKPFYFTRIATLYLFFDDYEKAVMYFNKALETPEVAISQGHYEWLTNELGIIYRNNYNDLERSDSCFHAILELIRERKTDNNSYMNLNVEERNELWMALAKGNLGTNCYVRGEYDEAIPLFIESMEGAVKNNTYNYPYAAGKALMLADIYLKQHNLPEVKRYADMARAWLDTELDVSRAHNIGLWQKYYQTLTNYYRTNGDYANAWLSSDSLESKKKITEEEYNRQQLHNAEQQLKQEELEAEQVRNRTYRRNLLTAVGFLAVMILFLSFILYHYRQIANKNTAIVRQIQEQQKQQEITEQQGSFIPDRRYDRLCIQLRNLMLTDKIYLDSLLTRDSLAEQLDVNKDLFSDVFRSCFGMTFNEYINLQRLKEAIVLLEQSEFTIEKISQKTGFGTVRTFERQFQNKYNMSPKSYRKASQKVKESA